MDLSGVTWRKSSRSGGNNECVELACLATGSAVRDSKAPQAGTLTFDDRKFGSFLAAIKAGRLDG
ncbi:DUF397 domain-containing protein [Solihabitans fulvus]|uniref:DUF397 domain-containing protein n=1 Tax=Solihabitans fulvus TaxID=1892852 RepID=A0A5B2XU29_9PSEU|nr:DUF397 domain-containing protein [Solihabitans fulvus]KAA2267197.1 DUF397 domain-containing protein [Solihabitans fulvus]